ncbi:hypothetical protein AB0B01_10440 [Streptomyces sp. NPDC044571]|uniref:hypothetical protein n=1 Tax=Streptomyces sp. NPDC044571 TaxID=3155371 RepID=UPI0033E7E22E
MSDHHEHETVKAVPDGYTTVTPWIIGNDTAALIDYLERAFGAEDLGRFARAAPPPIPRPSCPTDTGAAGRDERLRFPRHGYRSSSGHLAPHMIARTSPRTATVFAVTVGQVGRWSVHGRGTC